MKNFKQKPVDLTNDFECVSLGIRNPPLAKRVEGLWRKSPKEKTLLKKLRRSVKISNIGWAAPRKEASYVATLTVNVSGYPKSTYTFKKRPNTMVNYLLDKFQNHIIKAYWNDKQII